MFGDKVGGVKLSISTFSKVCFDELCSVPAIDSIFTEVLWNRRFCDKFCKSGTFDVLQFFPLSLVWINAHSGKNNEAITMCMCNEGECTQQEIAKISKIAIEFFKLAGTLNFAT